MDFDLKRRAEARLTEGSSLQFGIEEEYFLCDSDTLQPAMNTPEALFKRRHPRRGAALTRERFPAQLEVATRPHISARSARYELVELRPLAADAAREHRLAI